MVRKVFLKNTLLALLTFLVPISGYSSEVSVNGCLTGALRYSQTQFVSAPIVQKTDSSYVAIDPANKRFQIMADLYAGDLDITLRTKLENGTRSKVLKAKEHYRNIVNHFGDRTQRIKSKWSYGDNLEHFNALKAMGFSDEDAVWGTWSGRMSKENGFGKIQRIRTIGNPPNYMDVEVIFVRP